jgi:hypothetical protein
VELDEASNPVELRLVRPNAVMLDPDSVADLVEQRPVTSSELPVAFLLSGHRKPMKQTFAARHKI